MQHKQNSLQSQTVGGNMTENHRKRLIEALKAERARLNNMTDYASNSGKSLNHPELLRQSGVVVSLLNDLDRQAEPEPPQEPENGENRGR